MNSTAGQTLLDRVGSPDDLRALSEQELPPLAGELRQFLVHNVARSGGHLAAGLGAVELTIALHYVFDTPHDTLVWDVGHQCYPHKILTGRRAGLPSIRRHGGLSGFLRREESPYDAFGAGHSSTSISSALGIAVAKAQLNLSHSTVAIIGDGGMTAGLAFEALNHAGSLGVDLLVILNDNGMSISPNVGALSQNMRLHDAARGVFAGLGFDYHGPCNGHDLPALVAALRAMRTRRGPRLLHVVTQKGHGYAPAAADPVRYHGVASFDPALGIVAGKAAAPTFTDGFGQWLSTAAARDPRVVAITPAMREGSGLVEFARRFPQRFFDVGIAEQHCVTFAAGLASRGLRPVVAIYSTFLQRAYDQLVHDVALQKLPVIFAIDRAGLVGPDGATHNGSYDLAYLRCVPGMTVMTPSDGDELSTMLDTALRQDAPVAVRYPRAPMVAFATEPALAVMPLGTAAVRRAGNSVAFLTFGPLLHTVMKVAEGIDATVINMRFVKPIDVRAVLDAARTHDLLVTVEESCIAGGAGSAVAECLAAHGESAQILTLGLPDRAIEHGSREEVLREAGLDRDGILAALADWRAVREAVELRTRFNRSGKSTPARIRVLHPHRG